MKELTMKLPVKTGDTLYFVQEHLYYDKSKQTAPFFEYIVVEGKVVRFNKGGYTEIVLHAKVDHILNVYYYKTSDFEKSIFRDYKDAVRQAIRATEMHERKWEWMDGKLRRTWEQDERLMEPVQMSLFDFMKV